MLGSLEMSPGLSLMATHCDRDTFPSLLPQELRYSSVVIHAMIDTYVRRMLSDNPFPDSFMDVYS